MSSSATLESAPSAPIRKRPTSLRHLDDDIKTVLKLSSGQFKEQFSDQRQSYIDTVGAAELTSSSSVAESGVVSSTGNKVVVLLAVTAKLQNDKTPEGGDQRTYRALSTAKSRIDGSRVRLTLTPV